MIARLTHPGRVAVLLAALLFVPAAAGAQTSTGASRLLGSVTVEVTGLDGKPLGGATVVLTGPSGDRRATSGTGAYTFRGVGAGKYTVRVERRGNKPFPAGEVKLAAGETAFFAVDLAAGPAAPPAPEKPAESTKNSDTSAPMKDTPPAKDPTPPMKETPPPPMKETPPAADDKMAPAKTPPTTATTPTTPVAIPSPKAPATTTPASMPATKPAEPPMSMPVTTKTPPPAPEMPKPAPATSTPPAPAMSAPPAAKPAAAIVSPPSAPPMSDAPPAYPPAPSPPADGMAQTPVNPRLLGSKRTSRISDESVPRLDVEHYPKRPKPLLELGPRFLGNGNLPRGFTMPGGAIWTPQLIAFGTMRTALQGLQNQTTGYRTEEWSNRLDLFANLQLSGTERLLIGFRPLDGDLGSTGYNFSQGMGTRLDDHLNRQVRTLFFQGDIGEMFPSLDPMDRGRWDIGFAVGRQPFEYQDGILINDAVDAVGVTRNTIIPHGGSNLQITGLYVWNGLHGSNNMARPDAQMFGFVTNADIGKSTINAQVLYVDDRVGPDNGLYWAVSRARRVGHTNVSMRAAGSYALTPAVRPLVPVVDTGHVFVLELSRTPAWTHNLFYTTVFAAVGDFTSASRAPGTGGPLGHIGILFASSGFGRYPAPFSNRARDAAGGSIGYQKLFGSLGRRQLVFEAVGRVSREKTQETAYGGGARYQQAFGRHLLLQFDGFGKYARFAGKGLALGLRIESRIEF